jgi:NitT/TauT family transport system substrate-binding protein
MKRTTWQWVQCAAVIGVLATLALACAPAAAPASQPPGKLEKTSLKLGIPTNGAHLIPLYIAAERTAREEGLELEIVSLNGDATTAQAVASGSVDVSLLSLNGLVNVISSGHPVKGFYGAARANDTDWYARPDVKIWDDLKGKSLGILAHGGNTDLLTRHALRKHGLEPERDVNLVATGGSANSIAALRAGRVDAAYLVPPFGWQAEAEGYTRLGTRSQEVTPDWPDLVLSTREAFLDEGPNTLRALLRSHVRAVRLIKSDREAAVQSLMNVVKIEQVHADRAYQEVVAGLDEHGKQFKEIPVFWELTMAGGEVTEPWAEERFLDRRFIDTFDQWVPR